MRLNRGSRACAAVMLAVVFLAGCAAPMAYREGKGLLDSGQPVQGLAKLEEAVKLDPRNVEYRMALITKRASALNALLGGADVYMREGRWAEAEAGYRLMLKIDPSNLAAQQGLQALRMEERHRALNGEAQALVKQGGNAALAEARAKLRSVLVENPNQREALALQAKITDALAREFKDEKRLAQTYRKPITLEMQGAPIRAAFDVIAQVSGLKFFFDDEVRPDLRTTIFAKDTSIEDAIRMILVTSQLEQKVLNDRAILIYPNTPQKVRDYQTLMVRSFYVTNADVKGVAAALKAIVKVRDMSVDERLGLIVIRETPEAIRVAERVVAMHDLGDPEVMLEVEVMEIKRSRLMELGIQWPSQLTLSPLPSGTTLTLQDLRNLSARTLQATVGGTIINARKEDQDGTTLANPRIRVRNKEKAKILIGDRVPVISNTATSSGFISESITYLDVGLKLDVEPTVYFDDEVGIKINLEVSTLVKEILSKSGALSYQIGTRGAGTVLRLKNGETQTLAGLISDEDRSSANKIPAIGELPILGRLFGSQKDDSQRSEILLSITPRIIRGIPRPDLATIEFDSGTESRMGASALTLSPVEAAPGTQQQPMPNAPMPSLGPR